MSCQLRRSVLCALSLAFVCGLIAAAWMHNDDAWNFKSPSAQKAKARYDKAVAEAQKKLLADLEEALTEATKANDLDEAIRIREAKRLIAGTSKPTPPRAKLREGAYILGRSQYRIVLTDVTWREAREACRKAGGDLAVIDSREKREVLRKLVGGTQPWVGAWQDPRVNRWVWVNGQAVAADAWAPQRPNGNGPVAVLFGNGFLGDSPEQLPNCKGYICEWVD
jgi:hypothetical protein